MLLVKASHFGSPALSEPAWSLCYPSEAKEVPLASTPSQEAIVRCLRKQLQQHFIHPRERLLSSPGCLCYAQMPAPPELGPGPHSAAFQSLSKTLEKKNNLKSLTLHYGKNIKKLSCSLKPYICKCAHLNNCQFICLIKLGIQILAAVCTVVSLPGSGLNCHMKDEMPASLLGPCLFRTERNN